MINLTNKNLKINHLSVATKDKYTFTYNNKLQYFKTCANMSKKEMSRALVNEVLISHIARKCGINCVEMHFAQVEKSGEKLLGVLSSSFCEEGFDRTSLQTFLRPYFLNKKQQAQNEAESKYWSQRMVDILYDVNVADSLDAISFYLNNQGFEKENFSKKDVLAVKESLVNIAALDFLTLNEDRHSDNIDVLVPQIGSDCFLKVAPVFDNERSFLCEDDSFDFVTYRIDKNSNQRSEKEYAKQINSFVKSEGLLNCKKSIDKLKNIDIKQEIVECLSSEFECEMDVNVVLQSAQKLGLDITIDDLKEKANVFSHQQSLLKENSNVNS